eukprot:15410754-Heterocapsa_arctica.AAC.1
MVLKLEIGLKLRCCAKLPALCKESSGDSEDARRPFKNLQHNILHYTTLHYTTLRYTTLY